MPIKLACGGCNAVLNAPDNSAGKRVKCPKCGVLLIIPTPEPEPEFEMVEEEPVPAPTAKRKPAVIRDDDDDEEPKPIKRKSKVTVEEDEDDEPRKSKRRRRDEDDDDQEEDEAPRRKRGKGKKEKPKTNLVLILGIVFGVLLLLGVVGVVVAMMMGGGGTTKGTPSGNSGPFPASTPSSIPSNTPSNIPTGWKEFKQPEFEMLMPSEGYPPKDGMGTIPENDPRRKNIVPGTTTYVQEVGKGVNESGVFVLVMPIPAEQQNLLTQNSEAYLDLIVSASINNRGPDAKIENKDAGTLGGKPGRRYSASAGGGKLYIRGAVVESRLYLVMVGGKNLDENGEFVKTIFDNFKIKP